MRKRSDLRGYQVENINHVLKHDNAMLWLGMGLGKTAICLTAIVDRGIKKVLIFGPLRVITSVWQREAAMWEHTKHLTFSVIHGTPEERTRALFAPVDVYLCNYENMNWLAEQLVKYFIKPSKEFPFQCVIYDEVSKMKNSTSMRMAGGKRDLTDKLGTEYTVTVLGWRKLIDYFKYRIGLTGTPASNGYIDLHGQFLAVDNGERLGKFITHYRESYFTTGYSGWGYEPTELGKGMIEKRISDITKKMNSRDYLDLPPVKTTNMIVELPSKARRVYKELEKEMFATLDSGTEIEVFNRASVYNKCLQFCNGSPYTENGVHEAIHDAKLNALESVLEEAAGQPVLCSYSFKADAERIMKKFKKYRPVNLTEESANKTGDIIERWNKGQIKLLIGHPASMGHGIDGLQDSGNILVWFGLNWSLELYEQMNGRLDRSGQKSPVSIIRILCDDTLDLAVADALERKNSSQEGLKSALDRYRNGYTTKELDINFY